MIEDEFSDNAKEEILDLKMSEVEKQKLRRPTGMFSAVRDGIVNLVNETLGVKNSTKSVDTLDESGLALLHQAAQYDRTDAVRSLLDQDAEIDVRTREDNLTPLHIAARLVNLSREIIVLVMFYAFASSYCIGHALFLKIGPIKIMPSVKKGDPRAINRRKGKKFISNHQ